MESFINKRWYKGFAFYIFWYFKTIIKVADLRFIKIKPKRILSLVLNSLIEIFAQKIVFHMTLTYQEISLLTYSTSFSIV